jgi:proteasome lid subunit RPN8/RPN11
MQSGDYHIIVGHPYDAQSWTCYDRVGNNRSLEVLDVEIDESDAVYDDIKEAFGAEND